MKRSLFIFNLLIPSVAAILIMMYIYYGRFGYFPNLIDQWLLYVGSLSTGITIGLGLHLLDNYFTRLWNADRDISTLISLQIAIKTVSVLAFILLISYLVTGFTFRFNTDYLLNNYYDEFVKLIILSFSSIFIHSLISFALQSYNQYAYLKIDRIRQERKQVELQYEALKSQLSPHYLFNCLNTISSLVYKNANQTEDFIRRMAKTFSYVLKNDHKKTVTLTEEVEFVKAYNYLLKVRFENQLMLDIDIPKHMMEASIPPLALQMLLENVVKHNIIDEKNKVNVKIRPSGDQTLIVKNNKTASFNSNESFKIGLSNIRKRMKYLTKRKIQVIEDETSFQVELPVLLEQSVVYEN